MEKTLKLYIINDKNINLLFDDSSSALWDNGAGICLIDEFQSLPFPSINNQIEISDFTYDAKRMGGAPTISATFMHEQCLDKLWTYNVYAQFNGEKYFIKQIPSSQYSNTDILYKHEIELISERAILDNVYFYDVVSSEAEDDKPVSNSTKFTFFGDIHEFAKRLNYSLQYRKVGYSVVVDEGISSEGKLVSFEDTVFSNAIQESYNTYEIPYYFVGKVIHFGFTDNAITNTFKYGADESLLSIQKNNANYKVVTRITGTGSSDNIPYYYPNDSEQGTLTLLYNGIESNNVLIKDRVKFSNLLLENKLEYTYVPSTTKELMSGLTVQRYVDISDDSSSERIYEFSIMSKFTMPAASTINMSFVIGYNKETYVRITNSSGTEQASRTITKTADNISMQLGSGVFTLTMTARVAIPEGVDITSMAEAQEWVNNRMSASAKYTSQSSSYWTLNGTVIYLADYGLELSSGFTPTNGDYITIRQDNYIQPSDKLLPPIYRQTNGKERFYEAKNNTYINPQTGEYYHFNNEFVEGNPREHIVSFEDIKPTIKGMTNSLGYRIDMFQEFAYDLNDNDDTYPEGSDKAGEYIHPYFFAKLRKFDGEYGFNLFDHAIDEGEMTISMTSGNCGACEWVIGVDENTQKNIVQVDSDGNLYRDEEGNVLLGAPQDRQNDTQNNEVWIALKKDINTFGVIMPNATYNYKPSVNDTFVILHIDLPKAYVLAAENRLKEELIKYMAENNDEKFNFSISFSRIFFAENPDILAKLNENARLQIEYDGTTYELYVSSYSYKMSNDSPLPEIQVELSDTLTISQNALQTAIDKVEQNIMRNVGSIDFLKLGLAYFLRKDQDDRSKGTIATDKQLEVGRYVSGVSGAVVYVDKKTGLTVGELDKLYVRMKAYFEQLEIINVNNIGGKQILSPFGAIKCNKVVTEEGWDYYRCYFLSEQDGEKVENRFKVGAQAYSKMFNAKEGVSNKISNRYYWRLVVGVGEDYIDLSKDDCDSGSDIPEAGDVICHRGHRTDVDYQNFIEMSSVDSFSPSITLYQGVNSYSIVDKEVVQFGVNKATGKAFMNVYGDMYLGNRDGSAYISYTPEGGLKIKGTLDIGTGFGNSTLKDVINDASTTYVEDLNLLKQEVEKNIKDIQSQLDGAIETWFFDPAPTLENAPAKDWTTDEDKNTHLGDLYYSGEGKAYRFQLNSDTGEYYWKEINDTSVQEALEAAKKAQDTADGKRKIFVRQPQAGEAYDIGDMWVNATYPSDGSKYKEDMLRAVTANDGTQPFDIAHWTLASKYTDDTVAKKAQEDATKANEKAEALGLTVSGMKNFTDTAFADGVIDRSEAKAIEAWIMQVDTLKKDVQKSYDDMATNSLLTGSTQLTTLTNAKNALITAASDLVDAINTAIADDKTTSAEKATVDAKYSTFNDKYSDYTKALSACIRYVEEKLDKKISTYSYLKDALKEDTTIAGGLVQTTSVVLGYTNEAGEYVVMAGTNGLVTSKGGKTPALWMGGDMIDLFDVYNITTGGFDKKDGVRYAQGLDRMDGTGYRANGNLWWDADGKVHADPLSFFVGENTVGALLASFQVVLKADGKNPEYLIPQVPFQSLHVTNNLRLGDALIKYDSTNKAVYVTHPDGSTDTIGFYAEGWVSAKGANGTSSGGGGGASALYQLNDVAANSTNDGVLGAATGKVLMYNGSKWQAGSVVTDISTLTLQINGSSLATFDGKSNVVANIAVPTKLSQLTDDVVSGKYLPLSGGKLTGALTLAGDKWYNSSSAYALDLNNSDVIGVNSIYFNDLCDNAAEGIHFYRDETHVDTLWVKQGTIYFNNYRSITSTDVTGSILLHSGNFNNYAPSLTGTGASGKWSISITGNAATATDADTLDGTHWQYILERSYSGAANFGSNFDSDTGWKRIAETLAPDDIGCNFLLAINRSYSHANNESYLFSISIAYNGSVSITQLSGYANRRFITKIRVDYKPSNIAYVDFYINTSSAGNTYYWYTVGSAKSYTTATANPTLVGKAYEFTTVNGCKSDKGYTGDIDGNSKTTNYFNYIYAVNVDCNNPTHALHSDYGSGYTITNAPTGWKYGSLLTIGRGGSLSNPLSAQLMWDVKHATTYAGRLWFRTKDEITGWRGWTEVLTEQSGNAVSATQLQTSRTLWGQPFNGTANVSGTLTGVGGIYMTDSIYNASNQSVLNCTSNWLILGYGSSEAGLNTYVDGNIIYMRCGTSHTNALTITSSGLVGIGTNSPNFKLHIHSGSIGDVLKLQSTQTYTCIAYQNSGTYTWSAGSNTSNLFYFWNSYKSGIVTWTDINGNFATVGGVTAKASSSDIRLKKDIRDYNALEIIRRHRSVKYHWNETAKANADIFNDDYWHFGLIAQEVEHDLPQMVSNVFGDYLVIQYERLLPIMWRGLQEVDREIDKLKRRVKILESTAANWQRRANKLELELNEIRQNKN